MDGTSTLKIVAILILALFIGIASFMIMEKGNSKNYGSLQECIKNANTNGYYEASFYDSYSSPGGTATTRRTYVINNDSLEKCIKCELIYTSGYGRNITLCPNKDCSNILKQTDIISIVRDMDVYKEFRLDRRICFIGRVLSEQPFDAAVCFDEDNRIVNYEEQGKRPFYRFSISGYETESLFLKA